MINTKVLFSKWCPEEKRKVIDACLNEHERLSLLAGLSDEDFRKNKRDFIQPIVDHIYNEIFFTGRPFTELYITDIEITILSKFSHEYVDHKIKSFEPGWKKDNKSSFKRVFTGACGHLAVLKSMGCGIDDMDLSVGDSRDYAVPDLRSWLGSDVGVKTASVIDYTPKRKSVVKSKSNFPLVLDYKHFSKDMIDKWESDDTKYGEGLGVEPQVIVATKDFLKSGKVYKTKCYIIGVVSPIDIINGASIAFTLDPKASDAKKNGGAKAGFYDLYKAKYFKTREELITILQGDEYKIIPYKEIDKYIDMESFYTYCTMQFE